MNKIVVPVKNLAKTLTRIRKQKKISQTGLSRTTGIHRNTLINYEKGVSGLKLKSIGKIVKALGINLLVSFKDK